jgi:transcription elongation GreA/GreB family factor
LTRLGLQHADAVVDVLAGARVLSGSKGEKAFIIVGSIEADPMNGKISNESPIGQSLMGKKVGDEVEINTPAETTTYKIKSVK